MGFYEKAGLAIALFGIGWYLAGLHSRVKELEQTVGFMRSTWGPIIGRYIWRRSIEHEVKRSPFMHHLIGSDGVIIPVDDDGEPIDGDSA